ncbi:MAG TPA: OmpA family protein [Oligoflexus sp.]|uniref:OmpA family protein n=1 Tax=Oligoflexus sp. TaxID=1971216 RepID=UPI002D80DB3A|nr:OmpA family protein [Oligoflexus sp.]HET9238606.1 OmpA family protein [Oligoflexus sp.]
MRFGLQAALLVCLLPACTTTDANNPEDILSEDDLDTPTSAAEAISDEQPEKAVLIQEAESAMKAADEDVVDYAIADYKSFDPSGIVVHFEFDDARLSDVTIAALDKIVAGMKKDPLARVSVRGHADKQGAENYNKSLSAKRAKAIEDYLIQHGIEKDRLNPVSMGESDPIEEGNTIAVFKKNRRGDFTINYGPSAFGKAP